MDGWSEGYVADISYLHGYYAELNPLRVSLSLLQRELVPPAIEFACELGFGQGLSIAMHGAASAVQWHGTDFNPAHAGEARELAAAAGAAASHLRDEAFADFCHRSDLPDFDFISLHGVWTWVSDANREVLVDFLRRKLRPGGVAYLSYNTWPGWSTLAPVRRLMADHAALAGAPGDGTARVDAALAFAERVIAANPAFAKHAGDLTRRFETLKSRNRGYLAHEYFNRDWQPMFFGEVAQHLARAKLDHASSARFLDHFDALNLTPPQRELLKGIDDSTLRMTTRDVMTNQQFRKDYWIKGARRLTPLDRTDRQRAQRVVLVTPRSEVKLSVPSANGIAHLPPAQYEPLLDALADHQPHSLAELESLLPQEPAARRPLWRSVLMLIGMGHVEGAQSEAQAQAARPRTEALNRHLLQKARSSSDISTLASPVTGGGLTVSRVGQLCLLARAQGHATPEDWARFAWDLLAAQGSSMFGADGRPLSTEAENLAELLRLARLFADQQLPLLRALQVVD